MAHMGLFFLSHYLPVVMVIDAKSVGVYCRAFKRSMWSGDSCQISHLATNFVLLFTCVCTFVNSFLALH